MADFDILKQMDIEEIHRKTRITIVRLRDILDKKFDSIDPTRAHGFIKILERELQLDLSEWVKEYDAYRQPNIQKDSKTSETTPNTTREDKNLQINTDIATPQSLTTNTAQQPFTPKAKNPQTANTKRQLSSMNIEISMPKQQTSYKTFIIAFIAIVIVLLIVFGIYFIGATNTQEKQITEHNNTQKQIVEKDIKQTYPTISLYDALNDKENERKSNIIENTANNNTAQEIQTQQDSTPTQETSPADNKKTESTHNDEQAITLTITPKQDVWFAWVDTITKARGDKYTKQTPVTLTITNPTAFHFGYAVFTIEANGKSFEYNQKSVTYMLYDKTQGMRIITQKEYRALGGK